MSFTGEEETGGGGATTLTNKDSLRRPRCHGDAGVSRFQEALSSSPPLLISSFRGPLSSEWSLVSKGNAAVTTHHSGNRGTAQIGPCVLGS
ncbi:unnamed protein product [Boreogadus saida]